MATYPASVPTIAADKNNALDQSNDHPAHHNQLAAELVAALAELGALPKGADASVRARLDRIDTGLTTALTTTVVTRVVSGTSDTLVAADADKVIEYTNAATVTETVPPNSAVPFAIGTVIELFRYGAGDVNITAGAGVTIRSPGAMLKLNSQYSSAVLRKRATDEWVLEGDLKV